MFGYRSTEDRAGQPVFKFKRNIGKNSAVRLLAHTAMVIGGLFVVTVLLAAVPGHNAPAGGAVAPLEQQGSSSRSSSPQGASQEMAGMDHSHMNMDADERASERDAIVDMANMHGDTPHMHMTAMRARNVADTTRANEVIAQLRAGIEKYRDYHVALNDGYRIFLPSVPQPEYHFTNYGNGFMASLRFDPAQPTSLLYKKTADGYELVGAMYTMPKGASEEQLNERVPLSVAMWHLHTNLCVPAGAQRASADWTKFGLRGSIASKDACDAAGGKFYPSIFGWMAHVYPYEDSLDKIFAMHHQD